MRIVRETPTLVATASRGNRKFWLGRVLADDAGNHYTSTEYWQETKDGVSARQQSAPKLAAPKNVGRANETTPLQQATLEIESAFAKQLDKGYVDESAEARTDVPPILPMLAHTYEDKRHKLTWPVFVQAKENGIRCLWDGTNFWSRQGKVILPAVTDHLRFETSGLIYDGELVLPPPHTFQQGIGATKKFDPALSPRLEYRVYDCFDPRNPTLGYHDRHQAIWRRCSTLPAQVVLVDTRTATDEDELLAVHAEFVAAGVEGTIVRSRDGVYTPRHRSDTLLKLKSMTDSEFTIVGFADGRGKDEGAVIFECVTPEGRRFNVRPEGSMEERRRMFAEGSRYLGLPLTVRFQTLTDDGIPLFPVGVAVRTYE